MRLIAILALCLLPIATRADPAPRPIDMTVTMLDERGAPMKDPFQLTRDDPECAKCGPLTLGHAIAHALFYPEKGDALTGDQKWARGVLAQRVRDDKASELSSEEVTVIKKALAQVFGGIVLVQAYPMLDPNAKPPKVQ